MQAIKSILETSAGSIGIYILYHYFIWNTMERQTGYTVGSFVMRIVIILNIFVAFLTRYIFKHQIELPFKKRDYRVAMILNGLLLIPVIIALAMSLNGFGNYYVYFLVITEAMWLVGLFMYAAKICYCYIVMWLGVMYTILFGINNAIITRDPFNLWCIPAGILFYYTFKNF